MAKRKTKFDPKDTSYMKYEVLSRTIVKHTTYDEHVVDIKKICTGNTDEHTAGCLLLGDTQTNNQIAKDGFIGSSGQAYKRLYPKIADAIDNGDCVVIEYIDYDDVK